MLSLFGLLAVASIQGQSETKVVADIPFNFMVGDTPLPAGEYTVERVRIASTFLLIQSADGRMCTTISTNPVQASAIQGKRKLVFHRYGDRYFLSQVWTSGGYIGHELPKSRVENELAKSASKPQTASVTGHQR